MVNITIYAVLAAAASVGIVMAVIFLAINIRYRNQRYDHFIHTWYRSSMKRHSRDHKLFHFFIGMAKFLAVSFISNHIAWLFSRYLKCFNIYNRQKILSMHVSLESMILIMTNHYWLLELFLFTSSIFHRYIKMSSPHLNNLIIIGCMLTYSSVIFLGLDSQLSSVTAFPYICTARAWLLMAGFSLAFGSMFSKTWRVHSIFTDVKLNKKVRENFSKDITILKI